MKHGMYKTSTYNTWVCMRRRCRGEGHWKYTEKNIGYDPSWEEFTQFYLDMGERPAGMTLDRIDNSKGYSKENCRWATPKQQGSNRDLPKQYDTNKSGYTGIHWDKERSKWFAQVRRNNKTTALGRFDSLEHAVYVRETWIVSNFKK
jgi:hypothetical protein